jgi:hypothetical protein
LTPTEGSSIASTDEAIIETETSIHTNTKTVKTFIPHQNSCEFI